MATSNDSNKGCYRSSSKIRILTGYLIQLPMVFVLMKNVSPEIYALDVFTQIMATLAYTIVPTSAVVYIYALARYLSRNSSLYVTALPILTPTLAVFILGWINGLAKITHPWVIKWYAVMFLIMFVVVVCPSFAIAVKRWRSAD